MASPRWLLIVVASVSGACAIENVAAQDQKPKQLVVLLDQATVLKMTTGKAVMDVRLAKADIVSASAATDDPSTIVITGVAPGQVGIDLTDEDGKKEKYTVLVMRHFGVPLGVDVAWQWPAKKPIKKVALVDNEKLARLRVAANDSTTLQIEPLAEGGSRFTLTDADGNSETIGLEIRKPDLMLNVGTTAKLTPKSKMRIAGAHVPRGLVLEVKIDPSGKAEDVQLLGDPDKALTLRFLKNQPSSLTVTARAIGLTAVFLQAVDGKPETVYVGVKPSK